MYVLARDNHNSVMGIREYAKRAGQSSILGFTDELRFLNLSQLLAQHQGKIWWWLFQPNKPQRCDASIGLYRSGSSSWCHRFADAAAYVPSHELNLHLLQPDAVCVSFYKIWISNRHRWFTD